MTDYQALAEPFGDADLEWRIQRVGENSRGVYAVIVPYVTARAVFDRLDHVVGPDNWQAELRELKVGQHSGLFAGIAIRTEHGWVWKWDVAEASDIEPVKGAASGAYKRAAVLWGMGRDLYGIGDVYAVIGEQGDHYWKGEYKVKGQKKDGSFRWSPPKRQVTYTPRPAVTPEVVKASPIASPPGPTRHDGAPTEKQLAFYDRLSQSHVFTDAEREAMAALRSRLTRQTAKDSLDSLLNVIAERTRFAGATPRPAVTPEVVKASPIASPPGPTRHDGAPTEKQLAFYDRLSQSHVFTDAEREAMAALRSRLTRQTAKDSLDSLLKVIAERKAAEKAAGKGNDA